MYMGYTNLAGHPPKYKTPQEMADKVIEYFDNCQPKVIMYENGEGEKIVATDKNGEPVYEKAKPPTKSGLALYLGFLDRQSLYDYGKRKQFSCIIKRIKLMLSEHHEEGLDKEKCTGHIFWLKCAGWNDHTDEGDEQTDNKIVIEIDWGKDEPKSE